MGLVEHFLARVGAHRDHFVAMKELKGELARILAEGAAAHPDISAPPEAVLAQLAAHLAGHDAGSLASLEPVFSRVQAADLYLACACAEGIPVALRAFEEGFLLPLTEQLGRRDLGRGQADEVVQMLRAHLLVAEAEIPPRISTYGGVGPLLSWLRVAATRMALRQRRKEKRAVSVDGDDPLPLRASGSDPEMAYLKARYRRELQEAFQATMDALSARERTLLRLHYIEGLNAAAIAGTYQVSRRTVERWLGDARAGILQRTRQLLADRLLLDPEHLDTLMGLVQSQIHLSVQEFMRGTRS